MKFHEWIIKKNAILVEQYVPDANKLNISNLAEIPSKFLLDNADAIDEITKDKGGLRRAYFALNFTFYDYILSGGRSAKEKEMLESLEKVLSTFNWTQRGNKLYRPYTKAEKEYDAKNKENDQAEELGLKKIHPNLKEIYVNPIKMVKGADIESAVLSTPNMPSTPDANKPEPSKKTEPQLVTKPPEVKPANNNKPPEVKPANNNKPPAAVDMPVKPAYYFYLTDEAYKEIKNEVDNFRFPLPQEGKDAWYLLKSLNYPYVYPPTDDPEINNEIEKHKRILEPHLKEINNRFKQQTRDVNGRLVAAPYKKKIEDVLDYLADKKLNDYAPPEIRKKYQNLGESVNRNFNDWIVSKLLK
jgi:hypothetical protein